MALPTLLSRRTIFDELITCILGSGLPLMAVSGCCFFVDCHGHCQADVDLFYAVLAWLTRSSSFCYLSDGNFYFSFAVLSLLRDTSTELTELGPGRLLETEPLSTLALNLFYSRRANDVLFLSSLLWFFICSLRRYTFSKAVVKV